MNLRVTKFLAYHRRHNAPLDARVERKLRSQPPWIQHAVIERGECTTRNGATNVCAIVVQRIIDLRRWYSLPREDDTGHPEPEHSRGPPGNPVEGWTQWMRNQDEARGLEHSRGLEPGTPIEREWLGWVRTHPSLHLPVPAIPGGGGGGGPAPVLQIPDGDLGRNTVWQIRNDVAVVLGRNNIPVPKHPQPAAALAGGGGRLVSGLNMSTPPPAYTNINKS